MIHPRLHCDSLFPLFRLFTVFTNRIANDIRLYGDVTGEIQEIANRFETGTSLGSLLGLWLSDLLRESETTDAYTEASFLCSLGMIWA